MKNSLKNIVDIKTGLYKKPMLGGDVYYIQIKNIDETGFLNYNGSIPGILMKNISSIHILSKEDILFAAKGFKNVAYVYKEEFKPAVASSVFFVLRVKGKFQNSVSPDFICWYLNNEKTQSFLKFKAKGTNVKSISKVDLGDLEISIPPMKLQKEILQIQNLWNKEKQLLRDLTEKKNKYYNLLLNKISNQTAG